MKIKKQKRAFTLLELLAVIVVLGIIIAIAVPISTKLIDNSKKMSFKNSVDNILRAVKQDQVSTGLSTFTEYTIDKGVITPTLIYDGKLNGTGFAMVFEDGKTSTLVDEGTFCVYKLKEQKKTKIADANCGVGDEFTLAEGNKDMHNIQVLANFNCVIGDFKFKKELESNTNSGEWIKNKDTNKREITYKELTPGEDYYFYGKVINAKNQTLEANIMIETENVPEPTITIAEGQETWKSSKNIKIDFEKLEDDCTYEYRINYPNYTTREIETGEWESTSNEEVNLVIAKNNTVIDVRIKNGEGHIIREASETILKVDPTEPLMTRVSSACYIKEGTSRDILERYFPDALKPYDEELQGEYPLAGHFGPSGGSNECKVNGEVITNINELPRGDNYKITCTSIAGTGDKVTTDITISSSYYKSQYLGGHWDNCARGEPSTCQPGYTRNCYSGYNYVCTDWYCDLVTGAACMGTVESGLCGGNVGCCTKYGYQGYGWGLHCDYNDCATGHPNTCESDVVWNANWQNEKPGDAYCKKKICRLDENGKQVSCRSCDSCSSTSSDTCAGAPEDTCD